MKRALLTVTLLFSIYCFGNTQTPKSLPTIKEKTGDMKKYSGFFDFYWEEKTGKIWLEIDKWNEEFLYINSLSAGVGSNDIGLDRSQLGGSRIVRFERVGPKVLMIQPNYSYRAMTNNQAERRSVKDAFAESVLWGFEVAAKKKEKVLVDASKFYLRDAHDVSGRLKGRKQGDYKLDNSRSAFYLARTKNFTKNSEVEVTLTFVGEPKGRFVRQVVPNPQAITVRQHHSFVELPDDGYEPRAHDPRAGFGGISYQDYATPISEPLLKRFISRHRLQKKNPKAAVSAAVEPIVYYVDSATPEPIRSALVDGAKWWNQAFEAAGYKDAFQVKILPEDADPMDIRYNVINWVHRSTRGWSYGSSVRDPRTGEIIKGHVLLGSLRVRQDFLIAQGLLAPYEEGKPVSPIMQEMALARLRQLSAHEVGHTLGIAHNFAASVSNRASVMDYPHPFIKIKDDGTFDFSEAYDAGIGEWDKVTIAYGYQDFPDDVNEKEGLRQIIQKSISDGLIFISDQDARPAGGAHPTAHLWDNGPNAADELNRVMKVRALALSRFSENNIRQHVPLANLEEVLVPIYLFHRYQIDAASKLLGGLYYTYSVRGDGQTVTKMVPAADQRKALDALLGTLTPEALALPEKVLNLIPPRAFGMRRGRENFNIRTGLTFDPLAAAETAANIAVEFILHPARAARLVEYHARDNKYPGFIEVVDKLISSVWKAPAGAGYHAEIRRVVGTLILRQMMILAANETAANQVRAIASLKLQHLGNWLSQQLEKTTDESQLAHFEYALGQIRRFQEDPEEMNLSKPVSPPAGSPIGMGNFGNHNFRCGWE